jgi:transketolase
LKDLGDGRGDGQPEIILMACGSEVGLIVKAGLELSKEGVRVRLVSFPSWELFKSQEKAYREAVLPPQVKARLAVEAGVAQGWEKWVGDEGAVLSMESFGASAPGPVLFKQYGFTVENVIAQAKALLAGREAVRAGSS